MAVTQSAHRLALCALSLSILASCAGEGERYALGELSVAARVSWADIEPIFAVECAGCHADPPQLGAPQPLLSYEQVSPWIERIQERVLVQRDMPPGGLRGVGAESLLSAWIEQGAPYSWETAGDTAGELAGEPAGDTAGDTVEEEPPTWTSEIFQVFEIYCNTCHADPPTGGAPFPLKTYEQSLLHLGRYTERVLERRDMPPGGISDPEALDALRAWIEAGGPE